MGFLFNPDHIYKIQDVVEATGLSAVSLRRWIRNGEIKALKKKKYYFLLGNDLNNFFKTE